MKDQRNTHEVKLFHIIGEIKKPTSDIPFKKLVKAVKEEDAIEQVYSEMGSRHKAKRFQVKIIKVKVEEGE